MDSWFRAPRHWSNRELKRYSHLFDGAIVNASGWRDEDKEGAHYRDYFPNASTYSITNWQPDACGLPGEIVLDLEQPLASALVGTFDVVFNHTVLEHIYDCRVAFGNLCKLTRDVMIIVVPFLQPYHSEYGDFWRFTPLTVQRMYAENGLRLLTCTFNDDEQTAVYLFAIGSRYPERWEEHFPTRLSLQGPTTGKWPGARAFPKVRPPSRG